MIELFRKEVLERHSARLHGDINLALPVKWQALGLLFLALLAGGAIFLSTASYARVETVPGVVTVDRGVATVVPTRAGVVVELYVHEGMRVARGAPIARVRVTEVLTSGGAASDQLSAALSAQEHGLARQSDAQIAVAGQERMRRLEQARGLERELAEIGTQLDLQRRLVASAEADLERIASTARAGFISRRDVAVREETLMMRRQQLAQLEQARAAKQAALADARRSATQVEAQSRADEASTRVRRGELERQRVEAATADGYVLVAPVDGIATAVTARVGQTVDTASPILSILPSGIALRAELLVPASSIGFIRPGQEAQLAVDGFPIEQFGPVSARILSVPAVAVQRRDAQGNSISVYPVVCEIRDPRITLSGRVYPLIVGMTLNARVTTRRQSLLAWVTEPFRAAVGR